jgi:predicted CxxxxCH...CXXCH cytochrome family protein
LSWYLTEIKDGNSMNKFLIIIVIITLAFFTGCSELKEDLVKPEIPGIHKEGINNPVSDQFHGKLIREQSWSMVSCTYCHGGNYAGGIVEVSCLTCHTQTRGPEACNTCHGDFADPTRIAPPRALNGSISTTDPGVGAHVAHLYENDLGDNIRCSTCHRFPSSLYAENHLGDDDMAEIIFGRLSIQQGVTPTYDFGENTCANTYCHGNFVFYQDSSAYPGLYTAPTMTGNNVTVKWNQVDGSQAVCGSCHGIPPAGHQPFALNECASCHIGVVDSDGNIIDQVKHINGVPNVFGN